MSRRCLPLLWFLCFGSGALAQDDLPAPVDSAEQRTLEFEQAPRVEFEAHRHLLEDRSCVLWLPAAVEVDVLAETLSQLQSDTNPRFRFRVFHSPIGPGDSLPLATANFTRSLVEQGFQLQSRRPVELGGLPAQEMVLEIETAQGRTALTAVLSVDEERRSFTWIAQFYSPLQQAEADGMLRQVMRDWTSLPPWWDEEFEQRRARWTRGVDGATWAARNALLDATTDSEGAGSGLLLAQLPRDDAAAIAWAFDGLLHPHPRTRGACLLTLLERLPGEDRAWLLAKAIRDPDPTVRLVAADLADDAERRQGIASLLATTDDDALAGAWQLLQMLSAESRSELGLALSSSAELSDRGRALLLAAVDDASAEPWRPILRDLNQHEDRGVRGTALWRRLLQDDAEALSQLRAMLRAEDDPDLCSPSEAVDLLAMHAAVDQLEDWRSLEADCRRRSEDEARPSWSRRRWESAADAAEEFVDHLEELDGSEVGEVELLAEQLGAQAPRWAIERAVRLGVPFQDAAELPPGVTVSIGSPGSTALQLGDLLQRPQLQETANQALWSTLITTIAQQPGELFPDPVLGRSEMASGTGIDPARPWILRNDPVTDARSLRESSELFGGATALRFGSHDAERVLGLLLRGSQQGDPMQLAELVPVFLLGLPSVPAFLWAVWSEQLDLRAGEDTDAPDAEILLELCAAVPEVRGSDRSVLRLERVMLFDGAFPKRESRWLEFRGDEAELRRAATSNFGADRPTPAPGNRLELDLARTLRDLAEGDDEEFLAALPERLDLRVLGDWGADHIATEIEIESSSLEALNVLVPRPLDELRSPVELFPRSCVAWAGLQVHPERLRAQFEELLADGSELESDEVESLRDLLAALGGEIAFALTDVPAYLEDVEAALERCFVTAVEVDPAVARRFLDEHFTLVSADAARRIYHDVDPDTEQGSDDAPLCLTLADSFLLFALRPEAFAFLDVEHPAFADSPAFQRLVARHPEPGVAHGTMATRVLADRLLADLRDDSGMTALGIDLLSSWGDLSLQVRRGEERLVGRLEARPSLQDEDAQARVRRLVGYGEYRGGRVHSEGARIPIPPRETTYALVSLTAGDGALLAPERLVERCGVTTLEDGRLIFESTASAPVPEQFDGPSIEDEPELQQYLRDERDLSLSSPELQELAREIGAVSDDPAQRVRAIVDWVGENLEYEVTRETSSSTTLDRAQADCSEYTRLTVSLCRVLGIPARSASGFALAGGAFCGHAWAEVYLDRWYEIDPTWGMLFVPATHLRMRTRDLGLIAQPPGSTFHLVETMGQDGRWVSCRNELPSEHRWHKISAAVLGDEVVLSALGSGGVACMRSEDRGSSFYYAPMDRGVAIEIVRIGRFIVAVLNDQDGQRLGQWSTQEQTWVEIPGLAAEVRADFGRVRNGCITETNRGIYYVSATQPPVLYRLDDNLKEATEVPLPEGLLEVFLLQDGPQLCLLGTESVEAGFRQSMFERRDGEWRRTIELPEGASALRLKQGPEGPEFYIEQDGLPRVLRAGPSPEEPLVEEVGAQSWTGTSVLADDGSRWQIWLDRGDLYLSGR